MHQAPPNIKRRNKIIIAIISMVVVLFAIVIVSYAPRIESKECHLYAIKSDMTPVFQDNNKHFWEIPELTNQVDETTVVMLEIYKDDIQRIWVEVTKTGN